MCVCVQGENLHGLRVGAAPGVGDDVRPLLDAVIHASDGIRDPAVAGSIHEPARYDPDHLPQPLYMSAKLLFWRVCGLRKQAYVPGTFLNRTAAAWCKLSPSRLGMITCMS